MDNSLNDKKSKFLLIVTVVFLFIIVLGATYAYFTVGGNTSTQANVSVTTYTLDTLSFEVGSQVSFSLDQDSFASGKGNKTGTTFAKVLLTANNKTNTATKNYYLYLNISSNTFTYTQNTNTPEILMSITNGSGTAVTSIEGLTHKTVTDGKGVSVSGFDITNKTGLIPLFTNRSITASPNAEEKWNVTVTYINYNADQSANAGKSFSAKLMIQKDAYEGGQTTLADYIKSQYTGTQGENGIYLHNSSLTNSAKDNSYRYAGANPNNYVCFGSTASTCPTDNLYRIIGVFGDQVKLIKSDFATSTALGTGGAYYGTASASSYSTYKGSLSTLYWYYWNNSTNNNTWSQSNLNTTNLNGTYLTHLGTTWTNKIATTTWKVGGNTYANIVTSPMYTAYQNEIVSPAESTTYSAKIGLMYVSDYGYAASPTYWTYAGYNSSNSSADYRAAINANWMYMGFYDWTISRRSVDSGDAFRVNNSGNVTYIYVNVSSGVRPVFYLASSTTRASGSGSASDPIRLN